MDIKSLGKDLNSLQARLELYENAVLKNEGERDHNLEMLQYYRGEVQKVRTKYLEVVDLVKAELG